MLEIGSLLDGKYRILSKVGQGGMSVVYMAINEKANKTWAVKEVRKDGSLNFEAVRQGLIAETDILKKLNHPHLPSIVDVIDQDDSFIIIMDYVEGNSLSAALKEYGALPQERVIEWTKQLCDVLSYLHTRKPPIIYRDMKPANIMLKPDGNVMLIDFGTAREFKEKNLADTTCLGTVGYAAPEQFGGMGQTDARTDVYNLGATIYHLVTGRNPSEPPYEIRPIQEANPSLSSGLQEIIAKAVRPNPNDRYQSAEEMMYALEHFEELDVAYRKKEKRKMGLMVGLLGGAVLSLGLGLTSHFLAGRLARQNYDELIDRAGTSVDYQTKVDLYEECIEEIPDMSGRKEAYLGLMQACKEDDMTLDKDEANQLERLIKTHESSITRNMEDYVEICFEMGKLIWYYYDYGEGTDQRVTAAKQATSWFQKVIENAPADDPNLNMARVYYEVGTFYRTIVEDIMEGSDKGKYLPFFTNMESLVPEILENDNESEIIRLELIELTRSAIQQYAVKFRSDGVKEESITSLLDTVSDTLEHILTTSDTTEEKRQRSLELMPAAYEALQTAYGDGGE